MMRYLFLYEYQNFLPKQASFYEYIWEVIAYILITGKGHLGPNIWLETPNTVTSNKDIICII